MKCEACVNADLAVGEEPCASCKNYSFFEEDVKIYKPKKHKNYEEQNDGREEEG